MFEVKTTAFDLNEFEDDMQGQLKKATQEWATLVTQFPWRKALQVAPKWLAVLMVILIAKLGSDTTWLLLSPNTVADVAAANVKASSTTNVASPRLSKIAELHLFGVSAKSSVVAAPINAKNTTLNLKLTGVMYSTLAENSFAFIANARGKENAYAVGDDVFNGVKIQQINPDHVILLVGGEHQRLPLQKLGSDKKDSNRSSTQVQRNTNRTQSSNAGTDTPQLPVKTINKKAGPRLKKMVDMIANNPQDFYEQMRIVPVKDGNGNIKGIKFSHNDRSVLREMGLRSTDIILEVNGTPTTDPAAFVDLMNNIGSVSTIELMIERRGSKQMIIITM